MKRLFAVLPLTLLLAAQDPAIDNKVAFEGDSISVYWGGNYTGIYQASRPDVTHCALAVGGSGLAGMIDRIDGVTACNPEVVTILIGANGLANATSTEDWLALLFDYTDTLRAQGRKVALATILPQYHSTNPTYDTIFSARRAVANEAIRNAVGTHIDAVIDFAADPVMGPDAAARDVTLYRDGTHPTDGNGAGTGGQNKLAVIYKPVVDALVDAETIPPPTPDTRFPKPPDVPDYVAVTPQYKTDGTLNTVIDSTVTPMPVGSGLTNVPIPSPTNRIVTNGPFTGSASPFCTTIPFGGTCQENKFRTSIDFSHILYDDPVRNYGQPGQSHLHCFYGSGSTNAYSTYSTLRKRSLDSTAAGTDANATGYWTPCIVVLDPYGNGKDYALKWNAVTVYYVENPATDGTGVNAKAHIPVGNRYVFGFDMDSETPDTQYAWLQTILDAANTAQGFNRYRLKNPSTGRRAAQVKYVCTGATPNVVDYIVNPDGSDPHGGTCNDGQEFYAMVAAPDCYDGKNLWSPGGYKNVIPGVWDTVANSYVCPSNYYRIPALVQEWRVTQHGWADRQRWVLSSDLAYRAARGLTAAQVPAGMTFHGDWLDGWDNVFRRKWEDNCVGVEHTVGHECNSSQISPTEYLKGGYVGESGAGGRSPQVDFTSNPHVLETDSGWLLLPSQSNGPNTLHIHGH